MSVFRRPCKLGSEVVNVMAAVVDGDKFPSTCIHVILTKITITTVCYYRSEEQTRL